MSTTRRLLPVFAIGLGLWWAVLTAGQTSPTAALSEALRAHVKGERFDIVTSIRGLPLGVRSELQTMWGTPTLDIAEPGAEFQATGASVNPALPIRRLILELIQIAADR